MPTPTLVGSVSTGGSNISSIVVRQDRVLVQSSSTAYLVDVSDPSTPAILDSILVKCTESFRAQDGYVVSCHYADNSTIIDATADTLSLIPGPTGFSFRANTYSNPDHHGTFDGTRYAYLTEDGGGGIKVLDLNDPLNPTLHLPSTSTTYAARGSVHVVDPVNDLLYSIDALEDEIVVFDISNPLEPSYLYVQSAAPANYANTRSAFLDPDTQTLYVLAGDGTLEAWDVSSGGTGITRLDSLASGSGQNFARMVKTSDYVFVPGYRVNYQDVNVLDASNPASIVHDGQTTWAGANEPLSVDFRDNYLFIGDYAAKSLFVLNADVNAAPNAPTALSPDGATIDRTKTNRLSWTHSDPDPGDPQSAAEVRYREQGASTWTTVAVGPSQYWDAPGGTFTDGAWEWQVRTTDNAGATGPWSSLATFTAATPPSSPSIFAPINGGAVSSESETVEWTAPAQDAYEVRRVADDGAGSPDEGAVYWTSGTVGNAAARSRAVSFPVNNRTEHVQVRVRDGGLWSSWDTVQVSVSYTVPATPTLTTAADSPVMGAVRVTPSHPAPSGSEPTVESVDLKRRETSDASTEERIKVGLPASSPIDVYTSRSGVSYEFQIVAHGDNGTTAVSAWTS